VLIIGGNGNAHRPGGIDGPFEPFGTGELEALVRCRHLHLNNSDCAKST
jgi:hypothetical protein